MGALQGKALGQVLRVKLAAAEPWDGVTRIYDPAGAERDMAWLMESDVVVAEVSMPSHGVGYEIASAEAAGKPVLCLYRPQPDRRLSAMLGGNSALRCATYSEPQDLEPILSDFLQE